MPIGQRLYKISLADADLSEAFHLKTTRPLLIGRRYETYGDKVFLRRLDADTSGDINELELDFLRNTQSKATLQERVAELFSPHPLLRDRFARLARLA